MGLFGDDDQISVPIKPDSDGFTGRECPECESYFKIEFGTGLKGEDLPCRCPYCGHSDSHQEFWTKEQIEHAQSVALRQITDQFHSMIKGLEFNHRSPGGISVSMKVAQSSRHPIRYYREKKLETEVVCHHCTLRYSVYGVFAFCPDCGQHNSLQILQTNLSLVEKMLGLASEVNEEMSKRLIENALEDCVSAFDGFGRELCRIYARKATDPVKAERVSFQNLEGAEKNVSKLFGFNLSELVPPDEWRALIHGFQKRHLLAHSMGVVDQAYIDKSEDRQAVVGRKISVLDADVIAAMNALNNLATAINARL